MSSNTKTGSASKIKMESFDDLFGGSGAQEIGAEQIINAPLADLHEFKDHPFKVLDDEKMEETTESIRLYGVLVPGIARPRTGGGYELIAGHRRKHGSERAGKTEMPIIVRNYSDDEATIIMVDSNIQREDILPSEKAKAYKMKYEAMKHQGKKSGKNTLDEVGEAAGENAKKVQRYIWLSRLSDELLEMVDTKKLGFSQGVDISFLSEEAQQWAEVIIEEQGCNVSTVQSGKLKEYGKSGELTLAMVRLILTEEKPKERKVTLKADKISKYFSDSYSNEEIENVIIPAVFIAVWMLTCYPVCNKAEGFDWFLYWIIAGNPFGIRRMCLWLIPKNFGISGSIGVLALNCIIGGVIGGVVLIFKIIGIAGELISIITGHIWTKSPKVEI